MIRDERIPFCYQEIPAMKLIRGAVSRKGNRPSRTVVIAVYQAFTEIANEQWRTGGREGFEATRDEVAEYAGVEPQSVDRSAKLLGTLGLLGRRGRDGKPNLWVLYTPEIEVDAGGVRRDAPVPEDTAGASGGTPPLHREEKEEVNPAGSRTKSAPPSAETSPLSHLLAELLEANEVPASKRKVTKRWAEAERLMQERDDRDPAQMETLLRWAVNHPFWRANILSMAAFREKFDQIRLQAEREGSGAPKADTSAADFYDG